MGYLVIKKSKIKCKPNTRAEEKPQCIQGVQEVHDRDAQHIGNHIKGVFSSELIFIPGNNAGILIVYVCVCSEYMGV